MAVSKQQLKEAFELCDTDGSGQLDVHEVMAVYKALGFTEVEEAEVERFIETNRTTGKGGLTYIEFERLALEGAKADGPKEVYDAFRSFDCSNTGVITREDLRDVADSIKVKVTDVEIDAMWQTCAALDVGGDGEGRFSFKAWREIMSTVFSDPKERKKDTSALKIPGADDEVWGAYEDKENADRAVAVDEQHKHDDALRQNREKKVAVMEKFKTYKSTQLQREAEISISKEAKWRERQMADAEAKERIEAKKQLVRQQAADEAEAATAEQRRRSLVSEKIATKKASAAPAPPAENGIGDEEDEY
eukprot:TRINITY_DN24586_c0_g1_i1.p2 TRINITY_DN24586_c0_g1~~TRINITY_DN24586_c0_g1_i1.p2  ORF type:complete len:305 (+),score=175.42 TRINITY_DN24586_c0_g1_i1:60-974(+)